MDNSNGGLQGGNTRTHQQLPPSSSQGPPSNEGNHHQHPQSTQQGYYPGWYEPHRPAIVQPGTEEVLRQESHSQSRPGYLPQTPTMDPSQHGYQFTQQPDLTQSYNYQTPAPTHQHPPPLPPRSPAHDALYFAPPPTAAESPSLKPSFSRLGARVSGFQAKLQEYLAKPDMMQTASPLHGPQDTAPTAQPYIPYSQPWEVQDSDVSDKGQTTFSGTTGGYDGEQPAQHRPNNAATATSNNYPVQQGFPSYGDHSAVGVHHAPPPVPIFTPTPAAPHTPWIQPLQPTQPSSYSQEAISELPADPAIQQPQTTTLGRNFPTTAPNPNIAGPSQGVPAPWTDPSFTLSAPFDLAPTSRPLAGLEERTEPTYPSAHPVGSTSTTEQGPTIPAKLPLDPGWSSESARHPAAQCTSPSPKPTVAGLPSHQPMTTNRNVPTEVGGPLTAQLQNMTIYNSSKAATTLPVGTTPHTQGSSNNNPYSSEAAWGTGKLTSTDKTLSYDDEYTPYPMLTTPMQINPPSTLDLSKSLSTDTSDAAPSSTPRFSRMCMGSDPASFQRDYYTHPSVPAFLICTWCYSQYIQPTSLASSFPSSNMVRKSNATCMFHLPRVTKSLWPGAVRSRDLSPLLEFMKRRSYTSDGNEESDCGASAGNSDEEGNSQLAEIQPCRGYGVGGVWAHEGTKWFSTARAEEMPAFVACEACYEDFILATPFGNKFAPRVQEEGQSWECDVANKYIQRALLQTGAHNDWEGFVGKANRRVEMGSGVSPCFGLKRALRSCRWWALQGDADGIRGSDVEGMFVMCEPCYMDEVGGTRFEGIFEEVVEAETEEGGWAFDQHSDLERWCSFARNHPVQFAFGAAESRKLSPDELRETLGVIATKPRCGLDDGIESGLFYNFCEGYEVEGLGICEACHAGTMAGFGMRQYLADKPVRLPGKAYCIFHPNLPRTQQFIDRMTEAMDTGNFGIFHRDLRTFLSMPPCPGRNDVENRLWYGWPDCPVCPDCFETFATGTALAKDMPYRSQLIEGPEICSMYSERQRGRYLAACESGNIEELLAATRERTLIWHQTVPKMEILSSEAQLALAKAEIYQISSHNYAMLDILSLGDSRTEYQTSTGYTYQSYHGVMAEREANESDELYEEARAIARTAESVELQELWARHE